MMTKILEDKCKEEQKELMITARLVPKHTKNDDFEK
jgi:hypothetical protein